MKENATLEYAMDQINPDAFYMNPVTGAIEYGLSWVLDFDSRYDKDMTWEEWCPTPLIEVEYISEEDSVHYRGEWVEVK